LGPAYSLPALKCSHFYCPKEYSVNNVVRGREDALMVGKLENVIGVGRTALLFNLPKNEDIVYALHLQPSDAVGLQRGAVAGCCA